MPKFELISIKEAVEATKETRWLDEKFGEEYDIDFGDCFAESETESINTDNHN